VHEVQVLGAYAADLSRRNADNLYDASHYPIFDPPGPTCRLVPTAVQGLTRWIADAYEYPPPFLLLPLPRDVVPGRRVVAAALVVAWVLIVGPPPLPDRVDLIVGLNLQSFAVALCIVAIYSQASLLPVEADDALRPRASTWCASRRGTTAV
jgi:hypothetical protein